MAFNADDYVYVIVKQIAKNFDELDKAIKVCPDLEKIIEKYRELQDKGNADFFALKSLKDKIEIYQQSIGDLVCDEYRSVEPLSIGLFGEWGSGKTHLLKKIEYRINQLQSNSTKKDPNILPQITIPIFFNAWRFEKEEHLIIPLFETMIAQMEVYKYSSLSKKSKKLFRHSIRKLKILSKSLITGLKKTDNLSASAFKLADGDLSVITDVVDTSKVFKTYGNSMKNLDHNAKLKEIINSDRLESIYYQIPQWIEKIAIFDNISFVFLIDDLDRCLPENTLKMLESIKLFLDVPSCAFVLAIDDDVVERGVAYHYRDYDFKNEYKELPITGHEYLEKMIHLPFRIPVIDSVSVREFLEDNYQNLFLDIDNKIEKEENTSTKLLDFFAKTIPPKPRKIKRTAMLFDTKIKILEKLELPIDYLLVAKITLLELFAPKLLRFIQNNGYRRIFDRLVDFQQFKNVDECKSSLANSIIIEEQIKTYPDEKDKNIYKKMMHIVSESYNTRMVFELDYIFDKTIKNDLLKRHIELKDTTIVAEKDKVKISILSDKFMEKLFLEDDETSWRDAFEDDELFAEGKALLESNELLEIQKKAKDKKGFCNNPIWLGIIAEYITQEQFVLLLDEVYPYKMEPTTVTFEEYDRYCEAVAVDKPSDEGWGRGNRPVINVSWHDATAYAKWLSEQGDANYRLPSEDEWYLACNVGKKTQWYFGDDEKELKNYAWYSKNSKSKTHPVEGREPNALGLYDMHGNVWEWCEDCYDKEQKYKVLRGGSWDDIAFNTRSADRYRIIPSISSVSVGFRLLRT